ncbi:MAG: hypothetical protein A2487_07725 [Candidatus Raymondbacteria bacterium RifOxyC12_full_50_8]|uniref:FecR protein domain-containing protein n=1 Tax=Candidatus Raymondbacteria bacterium RIFOXYD12_FULL_49_13 TaxID=1817890 RepID=A0A1F7F6G1_UNCRA|nr:MAG: hypothetical protein A2248_13235 [Candidatus Raymondbacteria bacterium RIFOXYA2_FULL_49_16]OGJ96061.1 MAG: hypothetical protein A2350_04675 [Candidatus Raymondbacteria bacterium RifOxyB12_full_50_8]OGJ99312.1 MAG: hypothetical protein A2487_07725 [Candidatus Raymondbacteria bacterium RifOxyC12_full_50_8]OGK02250.1 MAG: hypothetical protein A2519_16350 [Candidatus Raymondbacteria bacterium RIFOXYD12_FULL_49_13]OGP45137.1 MAG: hypothetical protein A2324_12120 [Candidatus Raymondbacteria b
MHKITAAFCAIFFLANAGWAKQPLGQVSDMVGDVFIKRSSDSSWVKARIRLPLFENDAVATKAESRCEVTLASDRVVRIDENALVVVSAIDSSLTKVNAVKGSIWVNVKRLVGPQRFEVSTPTASAAIRGTVFAVESNTNASKYLVFKGAIGVLLSNKTGGRDSVFVVQQGKQIDLVKNMEQYLKQQEKAFQDYAAQADVEFEKYAAEQEQAFEQHQKEQEEKLRAMLDEERRAFSIVNGTNCALRPIDAKKIGSAGWADWNRKKDSSLGW